MLPATGQPITIPRQAMRILRVIILWMLVSLPALGQRTVSIATMNCYWFFAQDENNDKADKPRNRSEYELKAGHLIGLLPQQAPLFIGLQEIGGGEDINALARSAKARYKHQYQPLFVKGKDTATGENVGALFDISQGWGVAGRPSRASDLEKELSKHLVVRLTNAVTSVDVCVIHLRRPIGNGGAEKQINQCRALLRWAMRHLTANPRANIVVLGDTNEGHPVGSPKQSLAVLFQSRPPMIDALGTLPGKVSTHTDGKAYDRIFISDAMARGTACLKLESVRIQKHRHGKGPDQRLYTDHYPVVAQFTVRLTN